MGLMGVLQRLILILKGYIGATGDRVERLAVEEELRLARARQEALEELRSAQMRQPSAGSTSSQRLSPSAHGTRISDSVPADYLLADYRLLGVKPGSGLDTVEGAWRELARRADPKRFPSGSQEERKAAEILKSINGAYARIREGLSPTEGRFGRLEL